MLTWLSQNIGTIIVLLVVVLIVAAIVKSMRRDRKTASPPAAATARLAAAAVCTHRSKDREASVNHKHGGSIDRRSLFGVASTS